MTTARTRPSQPPVATRPATVILNPNAGRKVGLPVNRGLDRDGVARLLAAAGVRAQIHETAGAGDAIELVREAARQDPQAPVIAAGGDGTLRVVARTLMDLGRSEPAAVPPIGIMPLGSVMNVSRSLGIPREPEAAARVLAEGHVRTIDAGEVVGWGAFFEGVGVGIHAELLSAGASLDAGDRRATVRSVWRAVRYRPARLTLELDDARVISTRTLVTSVSNGPFAGVGFTIAPQARLDDGLFDVRVFERFSRWELLRHFLAIANGRRTYEPRVRTYRSASVRITSGRPLRVRADGEEAGWTPVELRVRPAALRVIAPTP
jgi:YegS/Rv2252/BmrU family lipid kinase